MTTNTPDNLERALAAESAWSGAQPEPALWENALQASVAAAAPRGSRTILGRLVRSPWPRWVSLAALLALVATGGLLLPSLGGRPRASSRAMQQAAAIREAEVSALAVQPTTDAGVRGLTAGDWLTGEMQRTKHVATEGSLANMAAMGSPAPAASPPARGLASASSATQATDSRPQEVLARQVSRRASIMLQASDVAKAVAGASALVREERGEFIEGSTFGGSGQDATATLTLRVISQRFGEALAALRALGEVESESASGEDVTDQIVDLDARVRNERKIEQELLALMEARRGSPLRDVLELRDQISRVRVNVERLEAQADRIARRVSLATIVVSVRAVAAQPAKGLSVELGHAWQLGLAQLTRSAAAVLEWMVGNFLWLIALLALIPICIGVARRLARFSAMEPAPRL